MDLLKSHNQHASPSANHIAKDGHHQHTPFRSIVMFENVVDMINRLDFVVMYYFEKVVGHGTVKHLNRQLIILNVSKLKIEIEVSECLAPSYPNHIAEYDIFGSTSTARKTSLCRASDVHEKRTWRHTTKQIKYQIMQIYYMDQLTMLQATDFLISYSGHNKTKVQLIGQKQIFDTYELSLDQEKPLYSLVIPFYDMAHHVKGT